MTILANHNARRRFIHSFMLLDWHIRGQRSPCVACSNSFTALFCVTKSTVNERDEHLGTCIVISLTFNLIVIVNRLNTQFQFFLTFVSAPVYTATPKHKYKLQIKIHWFIHTFVPNNRNFQETNVKKKNTKKILCMGRSRGSLPLRNKLRDGMPSDKKVQRILGESITDYSIVTSMASYNTVVGHPNK